MNIFLNPEQLEPTRFIIIDFLLINLNTDKGNTNFLFEIKKDYPSLLLHMHILISEKGGTLAVVSFKFGIEVGLVGGII